MTRLRHGPVRILVIGHTYMTRHAQTKFEALVAGYDSYSVRCLVPRAWPGELFIQVAETRVGTGFEVMAAKAFFAGFGSRYIFAPPEPLRSLARFQPDIIEVEHEPVAMALVQVLVAARVLRLGTSVVLFSWENVALKRPWPVAATARLIEAFTIPRIAHVIAGNTEAIAVLRRKGYRGGVDVLPQFGLDQSDYAPGDEPTLREALGLRRSFVVGYAGRLVPEKGLMTLVEALCRIDADWRLLLVGRGGELAAITRALQDAGRGDRLVHVDSVPHGELPPYLRCMDTFVLPSITTPAWKEQFGHVLIEAMACGIPIIGSLSGAIPEVVADAGILIAERDASALSSAIAHLMASPQRRSDLIRRGHARVDEHYTSAAIAARLDAVYRSVLSRAGRVHHEAGIQ